VRNLLLPLKKGDDDGFEEILRFLCFFFAFLKKKEEAFLTIFDSFLAIIDDFPLVLLCLPTQTTDRRRRRRTTPTNFFLQ